MRGHRAALAALLCALVLGPAAEDAFAHAGLIDSDPIAGAELGASPSAITLTFSEEPEASLSQISVNDSSGSPQQTAPATAISGDPLSLTVPVPRLGRGVYTVTYKVISAVDGHATAGTYAFGIRESPSGVAASSTTDAPATSELEVLARWVLLLGLISVVGAASAAVGRFGRPSSDLVLAAGGCAAAIVGLVLLAMAQRRTADTSLGDLLDTPVGKALIWRAVAIGVAGLCLLVGWRSARFRTIALGAAGAAAIAAIAVHVNAGHAAAGGWSTTLTVTLQVAHFVAAGVWFGGLAALLLGIRGEPSADKSAAIGRFAIAATSALAIVFVTGTVRAVDELSSWGELISTGYGRAVLAKLLLIALIVALAARNRRRNVPAAANDLEPLRRTSRIEIAIAIAAVAVAALLGTLAPPSQAVVAGPTGVTDSGSDFGATVKVQLTAASAEPGPNRFVADVDDYESGEPIAADEVTLRFTPLDDPGVPSSSLELSRTADGSYAASGPNLAFDGRWGVDVLVERGADSVEIPLELDLPYDEAFVSTVHLPGEPPEYTLQVENGLIRISPDPLAVGPSRVSIELFGTFDNRLPADSVVVTGAPGDGPAEQLPVERVTGSRFVADAVFPAGPYTIGVVARSQTDRRLRGSIEVEIPDP